MSSQPKPYLTPEQYLALERTAAYKSEYLVKYSPWPVRVRRMSS